MGDYVTVRLEIGDLDKAFLCIPRQGTNVFARVYSSKIILRSQWEEKPASINYNTRRDEFKISSDWWPSFSRGENLNARDRLIFERVPHAAGEYHVTVKRSAPSCLSARVQEIAADISYLEKRIKEVERWVDTFWSHAFYSQDQALEGRERNVRELKQRLLALRQEQKFLFVRVLCLRST